TDRNTSIATHQREVLARAACIEFRRARRSAPESPRFRLNDAADDYAAVPFVQQILAHRIKQIVPNPPHLRWVVRPLCIEECLRSLVHGGWRYQCQLVDEHREALRIDLRSEPWQVFFQLCGVCF